MQRHSKLDVERMVCVVGCDVPDRQPPGAWSGQKRQVTLQHEATVALRIEPSELGKGISQDCVGQASSPQKARNGNAYMSQHRKKARTVRSMILWRAGSSASKCRRSGSYQPWPYAMEGSAHRAPLDQPPRPQLKHILHANSNPGSLVEQFHAHESRSGLGIQYDAGTHA